MEKLKEELENMNDLMEQKDTLTQKLEVSDGKTELIAQILTCKSEKLMPLQ